MSDADSNRGRRYERGAIFLIGLGAAIPGVQYHLGPIGLAAAISIAGCLMLGLGHAHLLGGLRILPFDIVFAVYIVLRLCLELVNSQDLGHGFRYDTTVQLIIYFLSYLCLRLVIAGGMDRLEALS
ncbi:hypothetical protein [Curtobacterium sp. TXMA1]|uniref:hypothetical protein n=1 Tax=Curtobacterium sp. TXMA1 TaxID=2876939 RepID=UPI001CCBC484|nr:hypothetical protein [Curtobacterium sp. TXMA1]UBQ03088.1 hypothetical protein LCG91_02660 [Curtobacterium sp. TXMA1]